MNKANECTCPSGDGSLVHPCPAHPAVEQVGGDERAAFELFVRKHCGMPAHIAVNWDAKFTNDAWAGWQARAALAQPSPAHPAPVEQAGGDERAAFFKHLIGRHPAHETEIVRVVEHNYAAWKAWRARAALAQPSPMRCLACGGYHGNSGLPCPNMRVTAQAQPSPTPHPASELDFSRPLETENGDPVKWICADVIEYKSARVCVAKDTGLVYSSPYIGLKIRNVMPEQAEAERPEVVAWRYGFSGGIVSDKACLDEWKSGGEYQSLMTVAQHERIVGALRAERDGAIKLLGQSVWQKIERLTQERDAALARVAELEKQEPVAYVLFRDGEVYYETDDNIVISNTQGDETDLYRWLPVFTAPAAQAQQLHDLDKQCRDEVARALGLRPSQERGFAWSYLLASIKSCVKASEDSAQAQHCVPELLVRAEDFVSGKEVPQAWLDVQAERRRQITAEGWTPEHDDLYCAAELPRAAAAYILNGANDEAPAIWPFSAKWWKPRDARANYMRAGALILAEIERLDRAAAAGKEVGHE